MLNLTRTLHKAFYYSSKHFFLIQLWEGWRKGKWENSFQKFQSSTLKLKHRRNGFKHFTAFDATRDWWFDITFHLSSLSLQSFIWISTNFVFEKQRELIYCKMYLPICIFYAGGKMWMRWKSKRETRQKLFVTISMKSSWASDDRNANTIDWFTKWKDNNTGEACKSHLVKFLKAFQ